MSLELAHQVYGAGPPLVVLHGLFGSGRNWTTLARRLAERRRVFVVDLRNHGASPWAPSMNYPEMAADLRAFLARHGLEEAAVLGHSMGGKAAMTLALMDETAVGRLVVVDIAPVAYGHSQLSVVEALRSVDLTAARRRAEVDRQLAGSLPDPAVRAFLLHNLVSEDDRLRWRLNLEALAANMEALIGFPDPPAGAAYRGPALFVAGEDSDYLRAAHHERIRALFPRAELTTIPEAGHWVHAERPEDLLARLEAFLE